MSRAAQERPILFSGEMVRAILDGRKAQTRRVVKPQPRDWTTDDAGRLWPAVERRGLCDLATCPYGNPGDHLWVRETFRTLSCAGVGEPIEVQYRAGGIEERVTDRPTGRDWMPSPSGPGQPTNPNAPRWSASIHMPRWASRLTLEVEAVRVERLQDITEADAQAEGLIPAWAVGDVEGTARDAFADGWDTINGKRAPWASNPWCWVVSFKKLEPSHDEA
jgi:hypothetical protein